MADSIRRDLFYGATYGLALSAALWTLILAPPPLEAGCILLLALSASVGTARGRAPVLGKITLTYPAMLTALLLYGPGVSLIAAGLSSVSDVISRHRPRRGTRVRHPAFDLSGSTFAAAVAAPVYILMGGGVGSGMSTELLVPVLAHAAVHATVRQTLARVALRLTGRARAVRRLSNPLRALPAYGIGILLALVVAWGWPRAETRWALLSSTLLVLTAVIYRGREELRRLALRNYRRSAALYRSVTRALTMTMEAKDECTEGHLRRVQSMCVQVGHKLGLPRAELDALAVASVLHDIGKLAVPEGILNKPGRLTDEEMERIKRHPELGADILESISFPYPLGPIVRHHHERWDGDGYPAGLSAEAIPLGSRILAAVDCYDALTSDRPYRKALSHDEAVSFLRAESDRMFDRRVVEAMLAHLESTPSAVPPRQVAPTTATWNEPVEEQAEIGPLSQAQLELRTLYEIARATRYGLSIEEYLTLVSGRLSVIVPYRSLVVYFFDPTERLLRARFALGTAADRLRFMTIPLGERLSGWAALQRRGVIGQDHESPLERDGTRSDLEDWSDDEEIRELRSTLAAPMVVGDRLVGVLALYDESQSRYTADHRRILVRVAGCIAEMAAAEDLRPAASGEASLTDPLTGVPNARFLWLETAHRLAAADARFGLVAFRITGLEHAAEQLGNRTADHLLCQIARRFAAGCAESETLVRFGHDLFLVLTGEHRPGKLVERWHDIAGHVEYPPLSVGDGIVHQVRLTAAHVSYPEDGDEVEELLATLDSRLALASEQGRTILPFRSARARATEGGLPA